VGTKSPDSAFDLFPGLTFSAFFNTFVFLSAWLVVYVAIVDISYPVPFFVLLPLFACIFSLGTLSLLLFLKLKMFLPAIGAGL